MPSAHSFHDFKKQILLSTKDLDKEYNGEPFYNEGNIDIYNRQYSSDLVNRGEEISINLGKIEE